VSDVFREAFTLHQQGDRRGAAARYRQILAREPGHADALHLLGLIACEDGEVTQGISYIEQALQAKPDSVLYRTNLAGILAAVGRESEAEVQYREALRRNESSLEAHHGLAVCLRKLGRLRDAEPHYRMVVQLSPKSPEAHCNLANVLQEQGQAAEAEACYRTARGLRPNFVEAQAGLARLLAGRGRIADAAAAYEEALAIAPDDARLHCELAAVLLAAGPGDKAASAARMALAFKPDMSEAWNILGLAQGAMGDHAAAFESFRSAVRYDPSDGAAWVNLLGSLSADGGAAICCDETRYDDLSRLLDQPDISDVALARPIFGVLRRDARLQSLLQDARNGSLDYAEAAAMLTGLPLLLKVLCLTPVRDRDVEDLLVRLRRKLLDLALAGGSSRSGLPFSAALARQCFLGEYVLAERKEERADATALHNRVGRSLETGERPPPEAVLALAAYAPLSLLPSAATLATFAYDDPIRDVIRQQVLEPAEESAVRAKVPRLTGIDDRTSRAVRAQYEESPYPRWTKPTMARTAVALTTAVQQIFPHLDLSWFRPPPSPDVLIAGCGTGLQVLQAASRYRDARFLAIDLSLSSLAYAIRKTREIGLDNVTYAQADILEAGSIDRRFDLIESVGVLHHMRDPVQGWRALVGKLHDDGIMRVALYSQLARRPIDRARALIAERGYGSDPAGIRQARRDILDLATTDTTMRCFLGLDMYSLSECRDLLFHVQEERFTIPGIASALNELGLEFLGFEVTSRDVLRRFAAMNHNVEVALVSLSAWDRFEERYPDTFLSMYRLWCRKRRVDRGR